MRRRVYDRLDQAGLATRIPACSAPTLQQFQNDSEADIVDGPDATGEMFEFDIFLSCGFDPDEGGAPGSTH